MADKKDKTKETKSGEKSKAAPKVPKTAAKPKAPAKESKKAAKPAESAKESAAEQKAPVRLPTPRLKQKYQDVVVPAMMKE